MPEKFLKNNDFTLFFNQFNFIVMVERVRMYPLY